MDSFIPSDLRRQRQKRKLTLEVASGLAGISPQHLSEIESSKPDPQIQGQLEFVIAIEPEFDTDELVEFGRFSRNWEQEEELDQLLDELDTGQINDKKALLRAQKLRAKYPGNLEIQNFTANRMWALEMRDEATEVWKQAYQQGAALIPKRYKGQITWGHVDNRSFLRIAHGYLLGLLHQRDGKAAQVVAAKLLAWCPMDNLGVRMLMGDIALLQGDTKAAMKRYLAESHESPAHWYQAGQIAFRDGGYVLACTCIRRGIAANPYIAEGLTGRTQLKEHLYWHSSSKNGPEWAADYLNAPVCDWTQEELDFVDWVFNSAAVLKERAELMALHEGLTYERDPVKRQEFGFQIDGFVERLTDTQSKRMVQKVKNRWDVAIWPWDRQGFRRPLPL
ncbi:MAG: helix-turn-helix transcriptional regulator [Rhodoferax sp.]|nr:helix-turn-helix transcriptional regulator [Rhodoferax sp.]